MIGKILRAALARPWEYISPGAPDEREIRVSPDGQYLALWEPGNEPWFMIDTAQMRGGWIEPSKIDKVTRDWSRLVEDLSDG